VSDALLLLVLLQVKHFIIDFTPAQTPYMFLNKGKYGHPGGILHAVLHAVGTFAVVGWVTWFQPSMLMGMLAAGTELLIHYHMDWFKMWLNARKGWHPDRHPQYWILLGFDQLVHQLNYLLIVWMVFG
jgi:hypothetical protein